MPSPMSGILITCVPTQTLADLFGEPIHAYTAEQSVADGINVQFAPETAREAGYNVPVILTRAAFEEAIQWTRPGDQDWQSEDARFWDVLNTARSAAKAAWESERTASFNVFRVPNKAKSGNFSRATTASRLILDVSVQGYDLSGQPCIIISIPGED